MATINNLGHSAMRFLADRRAQDLVEYALTAGFIAVAASAFFPPSVAPAISSIFEKVSGYLDQAVQN